MLGPGTTDTALVPAAHRAAVSRPGGWISPVLVERGRVTGTWERDGDDIVVSPFGTPPAARALNAAAARLSGAAGATLRARVV